MKKYVEPVKRNGYTIVEMTNGLHSVTAHGLPATLIAAKDLMEKGYEIVVDPSDMKHWPKDQRPSVFFVRESEEKELVVESEEQKEESAPEKKEEGSEEASAEQASSVESSEDGSSEGSVEHPDWEALEKTDKDTIEEKAKEYGIELDKRKSEKNMIKAFKEALKGK